MTLTLYNTLTRSQQPLEPLENNKILMYCCGITVYDLCHLGHARTCLVWDVARSYLQWRGYEVRYVQNFTDIDDKILNRARKEGSSMQEVSDRFIAAYFEDMDRLHIKKADFYPRATHTLDGIKRLISELEQKGFAYPAAGDVYYSVRKFRDYGKLSGRKLEDLQAGASGRVDDPEAAKKQDPFDFALWKASKPDEPAWESPWGKGRPGWHIECSAMVREHLGETIDIHVGGSDLTFPHHENEIAQSEAATNQPLAKYWLHSGMVKVDGDKMSKSKGNFTTIRDLLDRPVDPMAIRLFILQAHYSKPLDFTEDAIAAATNGWHTLKESLLFEEKYGVKLGWQQQQEEENLLPEYIKRFQDAVDNDFNFAAGIAIIFEIAKDLEREGNIFVHEGATKTPPQELARVWQTLVHLTAVLGFEVQKKDNLEVAANGLSDDFIEELIKQRSQAKKAKNYAESDRIRDELANSGIVLIDQKGGITKWHRK